MRKERAIEVECFRVVRQTPFFRSRIPVQLQTRAREFYSPRLCALSLGNFLLAAESYSGANLTHQVLGQDLMYDCCAITETVVLREG